MSLISHAAKRLRKVLTSVRPEATQLNGGDFTGEAAFAPSPLFEQLEQRLLLSASLPGLHLVDPTVDTFDGQVIYLDFDGEEDVTYNGPVTVEDIDVPAFAASGELAGQEPAVIAQVLDQLDDTFGDTGLVFVTEKPASDLDYSTIYVGGYGAEFADYGNLVGIAERIDVSNQDSTDNAFVFSEMVTGRPWVDTVAATITHETGHLLGYGHIEDSSNPIENYLAFAANADRTFTHPAENNSTKNLTLQTGTYTFRVDPEPNGDHLVDWFNTYSGASGLQDTAGLTFYDDYNFSFPTPGTYWVRAELYRSNFWNTRLEWEAVYRWKVTVNPSDLKVQNVYGTAGSYLTTDSINAYVDVKNIGGADANTARVNYYLGTSSNATYRTIEMGASLGWGTMSPGEEDTDEINGTWAIPDNVPTGTYYVYCHTTTSSNDPNDSATYNSSSNNWGRSSSFTISQPNRAPNTPASEDPSDGASGLSINTDLDWSGSDPDGDTLYYTVYLDKNDSSPQTAIKTNSTGSSANLPTLSYGSHYYWQVKADDHNGGITWGPVWDFYTEPAPTFNLQGWGCIVPNEPVSWGDTITITGQVRNTGTGTITPTFTQEFYISNDTVFGDADDLHLASYQHSANVAGNSNGPIFYKDITLPAIMPAVYSQGGAGPFFIGMKTDAHNNVPNETSETDNGPHFTDAGYQLIDWDTLTIDLGLPDLEVFVIAGDAFLQTVMEGNTTSVEAMIHNAGTVAVPASYARAWLSTDAVLNLSSDHNLGEIAVPAVGVDGFETVNWNFSMPNLGSDTYDVYVFVQVDSREEIEEAKGDGVNDYANYFLGDFTAEDNVAGAAEIVAFLPPTGTLSRGDIAQATVRVKNTDNVARSYWVGLSFSHSNAAEWPGWGWYDVPPQETMSIQPGSEETVTFHYDIPSWLPPGTFTAHAAVWEDYDRINHEMTPYGQPYSRRETDSFDLAGFDTTLGTALDQILLAANVFKSYKGLDENIWAQYDEGRKPLLFLSAPSAVSIGATYFGIPVGISDPTILIDLADLYGVTPEGQNGLVTVWVDGTNSLGWSTPVPFGLTEHSFVSPDTADVRDTLTYDATISGDFMGMFAWELKWEYSPGDGLNWPRFDWGKDFDAKVAVSQSREGLRRVEVDRTNLQFTIEDAWSSLAGTDGLLIFVDYLFDGFSLTENWVQGTDDDGNWVPSRPSNQSPINGDTGVSLTPVLWGSTFQDRNATDRIGAAHFIVDDDPAFTSPILDRDTLHWTWEFADGMLHPETTYYWKVRYQDNHGAWSQWSQATSFTTRGTSGIAPTATIESIQPDPALPPADMVTFTGTGADDGSIIGYEWSSTRDGVLSNAASFVMSSYNLTVGNHTIRFRVKDNDGLWSEPDTSEIEINNTVPTASMEGIPTEPVGTEATVVLTLGGVDHDEGGNSIAQGELSLDGEIISLSIGSFSLPIPGEGGIYDISYRVRDDEGSWSAPVSASLTVLDRIGPTATMAANDGVGHRSMVTSLTVDFSEDVSASISVDDLVLRNLLTDATISPADMGVSYNAAENKATWAFPLLPGGSLPDGNWEATLLAAGVADAAGNGLDGNGDGTEGDNCVVTFFRFFADADGDRDVDFADLFKFRGTYQKDSSDPAFNPAFDADNDGDVDFADLFKFRNHYQETLEVPFDILVSSQTLTVPEGGSAGFDVTLSVQPLGTVTVTTARTNGDTDLTIDSGGTLTFDGTNWNIPQRVALAAAEDADSTDGTAEFALSAEGAGNQPVVTATENDNDVEQTGISIVWDTDVTHSDTVSNEITRVKLTPDGQNLIVFHYNGSSAGVPGRIEKVNAVTGDIVWERTVTKSGERISLTGWVDGAGNLLFGPSWSGYTLWKYDSELGTELWSYTGNSNGFEYICNLITDDANNVYVAGYNGSSSNRGSRIVKLTEGGSVVWESLSHYSSGKDDYTYQIALDSAGNVFRVGADKHYDGTPWQGRLLGHNAADGTEFLNVAIPAPETDSSVWGVAVDSADNIIIGYSYNLGYATGQPAEQERTVIQKLDQTGNVLWTHGFDEVGMYLTPNAITRYNDSVFLMAYHQRDGDTIRPGIAAFTDSGQLLWKETLDQAGWVFNTAGLDVRDGAVYTGLTSVADSTQAKVLRLNIPVVQVAVINPDYYRILKHGVLYNETSDPNDDFYVSVANGTVADAGDGLFDPAQWTGVGESEDFIGSVLESAGFQVDYFEASELPAIDAGDYEAVFVQDPLRQNAQQFAKATVEAGPIDLLQHVTSQTFLDRLDGYVDSGGRLVLVGDAARLLENGAGRLNYGKTVTATNAEHVVSDPSDLLPADWLFIRGNPFCGRDRDGSGTLTVESSSLLTAGETLSTLTLHDGNDLPRGLTWSETVYAPTDGISLVDAQMQGTGEYVLIGSTCSPPEYTVTVDDMLASFAGYTFTPEGQAVFYLGSDAFFDYQYRDYVGTWHAGNYLEISNVVSAAGKGLVSELIDLEVAPEFQVIDSVDLPQAPRWHSIGVSPTGDTLFVPTYVGGNTTAGIVYALDSETLQVVGTMATGYDPIGVAISPDGTVGYATNTVNGYKATKFDAVNMTVVGDVSTGTDSAGVVFTPDGTTVYMTNHYSSRLSIIDVATNTNVGDVTGIASGGYDLAITPDGQFIYVLGRTGNIYKVSTSSNTVVNTITRDFAGSGGQRIAMLPNGQQFLVSGGGTNSVHVFDTSTDSEVNVVDVGSRTAGLAVTGGGQTVAVALPESDQVKILDATGFGELATIDIAGYPIGVAFSPDNQRLYVTSRENSKLTVISLIGSEEAGLVAHYPLDGNADDVSGNGNNGTVNGASLTTDRFGASGSAYEFDGTDDYISVPHSPSLDITSTISISAWVKTSGNYWRTGIVNKLPGSVPDIGYSLRAIEGKANFGIYREVGGNHTGAAVDSQTSIEDGEWRHLVGTFDGTMVRMYVDGTLETSEPYNLGFDSNTTDLLIGKYYYPYNDGHGGRQNQVFNGAIDDVRIYNRALSTAEIQQLAGYTGSAALLSAVQVGSGGGVGLVAAPPTPVVAPQAAGEPTAAAGTPVVPVVSQPLDDNNENDDSMVTTPSAPAVDLLVESPRTYIPEFQPNLEGSASTTLYSAATMEYDLWPLSDDLDVGEGDDLLVDILAESLLAVSL